MSLPLLVVGSVLKFENEGGHARHILVEEIDEFQKNGNIWTRTFRGTNERGVSDKEVIQTIERLTGRENAPFFNISYALSSCTNCKITAAPNLSVLVVGSVLQYTKLGLTTHLLVEKIDEFRRNIKKTKWTRTFSGIDNNKHTVRGKQTIMGSKQAPYFRASYTIYDEVNNELTLSQANYSTQLKY